MKLNLENYKSILRLGLPILIAQLGLIVVGFADNIMVGRYSTEALASASFVNNLFNTVIFACMGFSYGLTPIVAMLYTRGSHDEIGATVKGALIVNVLFALGATAVMTFVYLNIDRMGQPEELLPTIRPYFLIYLSGLVPIAVFNVFAQWSYAINNSRMPMWILLSANVLNIIGNYVLIYGHFGMPELGLNGAGISTLVARIICPVVIAGVFFMRGRYRQYAHGFRRNRVTGVIMRRINRTSWPVSMQMTFESGSFTFAAVVAGWTGAIALASFQVIVIVGTLGFCIYYSIGSAISVLVANAHGLSDRRAMRGIAFSGYHLMLLLAGVSSTIFIVFGRYMVGAFTEDTAVISTTLTLIFPLVLYQLGDATQITFANALRGTSNVMPMLWIAFVSYLVIGMPATYLLAIPAGMGIFGIILSFSVSLFVAAAFFSVYFFRSTSERTRV